jgi:hypothetical protein
MLLLRRTLVLQQFYSPLIENSFSIQSFLLSKTNIEPLRGSFVRFIFSFPRAEARGYWYFIPPDKETLNHQRIFLNTLARVPANLLFPKRCLW